MVGGRRWSGVLALLLMPAMALAQEASCGELEPCESPSGLGAVAAVRILENGHTMPGMEEPNLDCKRFQLTPKRVMRYLRKAGRITPNARQYATSDSPCTASGEVTFRSGKRATWTIGILKEGKLTFMRPDGSADVIDLYCRRCKFSPFVD